MSDYITVRLTALEAEELRVSAEVQMRAQRDDSRTAEEWQQWRSLEGAHRKLVRGLDDLDKKLRGAR